MIKTEATAKRAVAQLTAELAEWRGLAEDLSISIAARNKQIEGLQAQLAKLTELYADLDRSRMRAEATVEMFGDRLQDTDLALDRACKERDRALADLAAALAGLVNAADLKFQGYHERTTFSRRWRADRVRAVRDLAAPHLARARCLAHPLRTMWPLVPISRDATRPTHDRPMGKSLRRLLD